MSEPQKPTRESVLRKMSELYFEARKDGYNPVQFFVHPDIAHLLQDDPVGALRPYCGVRVSVDRMQIDPVFLRVEKLAGMEMKERYEGSKSTFESIRMMSDALALKSPTALTEQVGGNHYKDLAIQPAEYCQRNGLSYCESNVVKYVTRHKKKGGLEDIKKAIHNLRLVAHFEYGKELP
jgi:hypothetical protein